LSPADRVVVDWRISEYELVDDNEASHVDKPGVTDSVVVDVDVSRSHLKHPMVTSMSTMLHWMISACCLAAALAVSIFVIIILIIVLLCECTLSVLM